MLSSYLFWEDFIERKKKKKGGSEQRKRKKKKKKTIIFEQELIFVPVICENWKILQTMLLPKPGCQLVE